MPALTLMLAGALLAAAQPVAAQTPATSPKTCAPEGDLHFVCNLISVEDFVPVDGGRWLVGGSYVEKSVGLYLVDTRAKSAKPVSLSLAAKPDPSYAGCPAPDLKALQTHGVDVRQANGHTTVYAINHGGRESVEIFELHPATNTAEWIGCALSPPGVNGNAVSAMGGGAFAITKFMDTNDKNGFQHILSGQVTGAVYLWKPGKGFSEVPGTRFSGDNGLLSSARWALVLHQCLWQPRDLPRTRVGPRQDLGRESGFQSGQSALGTGWLHLCHRPVHQCADTE